MHSQGQRVRTDRKATTQYAADLKRQAAREQAGLAQALAQHTTIEFRLDRCSHTAMREQAEALAAVRDLDVNSATADRRHLPALITLALRPVWTVTGGPEVAHRPSG